MAEPKNKSRADKAVDNVKKKDAPKSSPKNSKKTDKKQEPKKPAVKNAIENTLPSSVLAAVICLCIGTVLLIISIWPDGWLPELIRSL